MDYNRTFGKHDVNAMFIYNQDELVTQLFSGDLIAALPKRKQGVAARLSYAYDGKYLAEVNMVTMVPRILPKDTVGDSSLLLQWDITSVRKRSLNL